MDQNVENIDTQAEFQKPMDPALSKKLEYWKSRLIDLSKRNRLVNFKETKSSTVRITIPSCSEVFAKLVTQEKTLTFLEPEEVQDSGDGDQKKKIDEGTPPRQLKALEIFGVSQGGKVTRALYNLRLRSRTALQETGINVLYVSFHMLEWKETSHSN